MDGAAGLAAEFAKRSGKILGGNLVGVYLHGSAAMGCFNPVKSDLDLLAVVRESPDDIRKRAYMDMVTELSTRMPENGTHGGIEMSMVRRDVCDPFVYPTPFELHYSAMHLPWYRRDPEDYIRKMKGTDKDLAAHFTVIRSRGICLAGLPVREVFGEVPAADYLDSIREDIIPHGREGALQEGRRRMGARECAGAVLPVAPDRAGGLRGRYRRSI